MHTFYTDCVQYFILTDLFIRMLKLQSVYIPLQKGVQYLSFNIGTVRQTTSH